MVNYTFPGTAKSGDGYCERIFYTDDDGPTDTDVNASAAKCIPYTPPSSTQASVNAACTSITYTVGSMYDPSTGQADSNSTADATGRIAIYAGNSNAAMPSSSSPDNDDIPDGSWSNGEHDITSNSNWPNVTGGSQVYYSNIMPTNLAEPPQPEPQNPVPTWQSGSGTFIESTTPVGHAATITYELSPAQIAAGNIQWYVIQFNLYGGAPPYKIYIDDVSHKTVNNCFTNITCSVSVAGSLGGNNTEISTNGNPEYFTFDVTVKNNNSAGNDLDSILGGNSNYPSAVTYDVEPNPPPPPAGSPSVGMGVVPAQGGTNSTGNISEQAPTSITSNNNIISVSFGYPGTGLSDLANCQANIDYFEYFDYSVQSSDTLVRKQPNGSYIATQQNPNYVEKTYTYTGNGAPMPGNMSMTGQLYYVPSGQPSSYTSSPAGPEDTNIQQHPSPYVSYYQIQKTLNPGDGYCIYENAVPSDGYEDSGGNVLDMNGTPSTSPGYSPDTTGDGPNCTYIYNEPYVSFTGNDVIGDPAFAPDCNSNDYYESGIYAFSTDSYGNYNAPPSSTAGTGGSGSQFGAQALGIIEGLTSGSFLSSDNNNSNGMGLTFANSYNDDAGGVTPTGSSNSPPEDTFPPADGNPLGGYFGSTTCEPDYYHKDMPASTTSISTNIVNSSLATGPPAAGSNGSNYSVTANGTNPVTIGGDGNPIYVANGVRETIFVKGNVYIESNIEYKGGLSSSDPNYTSWGSSISNIPSLYIVAEGNIYVAPNVTQLDGVYIAQPDTDDPTQTASTGIIDTCAQSTGIYSDSYLGELYGDNAGGSGNEVGCDKQLTVNGAIADKATILDRSFSSLRYSEAGENTSTGTFAAHSCGAASQVNNPGEINYSYGSGAQFSDCAAEIFNFTPEVYLSQPSFVSEYQYNYITSLSPIL